MKIHHLRNATTLLTIGAHHILIDPMLSKPGAIPGLKMFGGGRRANPLVPLLPDARQAMEGATDVLITHEHPDHIDAPAITWITQRKLPVWASSIDAPNLRTKGLDARELRSDALGLASEVIPAQHGRGILGWLMGPVSGFYLAHPDEPSVYITGDSVLTDTVLEAVTRLQPDIVIAPAGAANFGIGPNILFSVDELVKLARHAPGQVILNHLETLDHCPTTRDGLRERMADEGLSAKVHIPDDGDILTFQRQGTAPHAHPAAPTSPKPGFQKRLTALFAGT